MGQQHPRRLSRIWRLQILGRHRHARLGRHAIRTWQQWIQSQPRRWRLLPLNLWRRSGQCARHAHHHLVQRMAGRDAHRAERGVWQLLFAANGRIKQFVSCRRNACATTTNTRSNCRSAHSRPQSHAWSAHSHTNTRCSADCQRKRRNRLQRRCGRHNDRHRQPLQEGCIPSIRPQQHQLPYDFVDWTANHFGI